MRLQLLRILYCRGHLTRRILKRRRFFLFLLKVCTSSIPYLVTGSSTIDMKAVSKPPDWEFVYTWPFDLPRFSVVDTHTKRPYKSKPNMERIQIYNHPKGDRSYHLTLLFDSPRVLRNCKILLTENPPPSDETTSSGITVNSKPWLSIYWILFTVHHMVNQETRLFTERLFGRASDTV